MGEIILFASAILHQFEITSADDDSQPGLPPQSPPDQYGAGMELPGGPWTVRLRYRAR